MKPQKFKFEPVFPQKHQTITSYKMSKESADSIKITELD